MRTNMINAYLAGLTRSFGKVRPPVDDERLHALYAQQDYAGMVRLVRTTLKLDVRVKFGISDTHGPLGAPAWVEKPDPLPMYGTQALRETVVTIGLKESFVARGVFEQVVLALAHEFSHVVLDSLRHPLREQEEAVDLTAMLLGFRDFYSYRLQRGSGDGKSLSVSSATEDKEGPRHHLRDGHYLPTRVSLTGRGTLRRKGHDIR